MVIPLLLSILSTNPGTNSDNPSNASPRSVSSPTDLGRVARVAWGISRSSLLLIRECTDRGPPPPPPPVAAVGVGGALGAGGVGGVSEERCNRRSSVRSSSTFSSVKVCVKVTSSDG